MGHAAVGEVVARHHREHGVIEAHPLDRLGDPCRFVGGGRERLVRVDEAEPAGPRAALAEHHERRGAVGPALGQVGAAGVLAHGDEVEVAHRLLQRHHVGAEFDLRTQPLGLARLDRQALGDTGGLEPGRGPIGHQLHLLARALAARERRQVAPVDGVLPRDVLAFDRTVGPTFGGEAGDHVDDLAHRHVDALLGERGDRLVADAARHDVLAQVGHVGGDVEREAVHRAPVCEPHADRADLARLHRRIGMVDVEPDPGEPLEPTGVRQPEFGQRVDDQTFDVAHVRRCAEPVVDVDDRVADQLAGAVIGDVATALDRDQFGADRCRLAAQVGGQVGPLAVGEHVRVLEQQQVLAARRVRTAPSGPPAPRGRAPGPTTGRAAGRSRRSAERQSSVDQSLVSRISLTRARNRAA